MQYREFDVPAPLRRHVQCVWRLDDPAPSPQVQTVYPDGRCELIVHRATPMRAFDGERGWHAQAPCLFAGQQRAPIRLAAQGEVACLGVRLQPAASAALAGAGLPALRDRIVDLRGLDPAFAAAFEAAQARFADDPDDGALWRCLEAGVARHGIDGRIETAVDSLLATQGCGRIAPLAAAAALSPRAFQLRFLDQVGLGAKEFARVVRLQATLRQLDAEAMSLAELAADRGFADQAHATREVQRLTGSTPARLLAALRDGRDGDRAIRLAAAFVRGHG